MTDHRFRRWFQLSLKSLFLLTLVVATFFAGYSLAERRADRAEQAAKEALVAEREVRQELERELRRTREALQVEISDRIPMLGAAAVRQE